MMKHFCTVFHVFILIPFHTHMLMNVKKNVVQLKSCVNFLNFSFPVSEAPPPVKAEKPAESPVGIMFEGEVTLESSLAFLQNSKEKEERVSTSLQ